MLVSASRRNNLLFDSVDFEEELREKVRDREDALANTRDAWLLLCDSSRVQLGFPMPVEISIPDAEDLKSRVRELRRFL